MFESITPTLVFLISKLLKVDLSFLL